MALSLAARKAAYVDDYLARWRAAKLDANRVTEARNVASKMISNRGRYESIARVVGKIPWWFIGIAHERESSQRFDRHLHDGSRLTARTVGEPVGRPKAPPASGSVYTFEESAIDALTMPGKQFDKIAVWDEAEVLFRFEQYNGFGYHAKGIPSPYLWAGTNQSDEKGKYVKDHVFDRSAHDDQLGCVAIMLALESLGVVLFPDAEEKHDVVEDAPSAPLGIDSATILYVQKRLRALGYYEVGKADGYPGKKTDSGVSAFRSENDLGLSTAIDDAFLAALAKAKPRHVDAERAYATPDELAGKVPGISGALKSQSVSFWTGIVAGGTALVQGVSANIKSATETLAPVKDFLGAIPVWVWAVAVLGVAASVYIQSRKSAIASTEAYQRGEIS